LIQWHGYGIAAVECVIFCCFSQSDLAMYEQQLGSAGASPRD